MKKYLLILVLVSLFAKPVFAQVNSQDSLALVALYNATDGDNWTNNNGWLVESVNNWHGITVTGDRVTEIRLYGNNLVGDVPAAIGDLTALTYLSVYQNTLNNIPSELSNLSALTNLAISYNSLASIPNEIRLLTNLNNLYLGGNLLTSIPDLSSLSNLVALGVGNNKLDFGDLDLININFENLNLVYYSPQSEIQLNKSESGSIIYLICSVSGTNNQYKWFRNNIEIEGKTENVLPIQNTDAGAYRCEITDVNYPELTLKTSTEEIGLINGVMPGDYNALIAFYDATNGDNWSRRTNWKSSEPIRNWHGVTVKDYRVAELSFSNNQLEGDIPPEFGDLTALVQFTADNNELTSIPPEIGNLSSLNYLNLNLNKLKSIPDEIGYLTSLGGLSLLDNHISKLPATIGNLTNLKYLSLERNVLTELPVEIGNLSSLETLNLFRNYLTSIPSEISNLTQLSGLTLTRNEINELPDLSGLLNLNALAIDENKLDFEDLESTNYSFNDYTVYDDQDRINYTYSNGNISVSPGGTGTTYQWYKNEVLIEGATNNTLNITDTENSTYHCEMSNSNFPKLVLKSVKAYLPAEVPQEEYDLLVQFYNSTKGESWTNSTNWLSDAPVSEWFGITVGGNHVTAIELSNNNIEGAIISFSDLTKLERLDLANNKLSGDILTLINNLNNLKYTNLANNQLFYSSYSGLNAYKLEHLILANNNIGSLQKITFLKMLQRVEIENNYLHFDDVVQLKSLALNTLSYNPQKKVGKAEKRLLRIGANDTLTVLVGGQNNTYQWYKDGNIITNATNDSLMIKDFSTDDIGKYYCKIDNPDVADLTLESDTFTLAQSFNATFIVSNANGLLSNAMVEIIPNNYQYTDDNGETSFTDLEMGENIPYKVSAYHLKDTIGTFDLVAEDAIVEIKLVPAYEVVLRVSSNGSWLEGATVSLGNYGDSITNGYGEVRFWNVEPSAQIPFTINADNHNTYNGTIEVVDNDVQKTVSLEITGISKIENLESKLYPNPSKGMLTVELEKSPSKNGSLEIYTLNGKKIFVKHLNSKISSIDLNSIEKGAYIIKINDGERNFKTSKLIITK